MNFVVPHQAGTPAVTDTDARILLSADGHPIHTFNPAGEPI